MSGRLTLRPVDMNFSLKDRICEVLRDGITSMNIYDEDTDLRLEERRVSEELGTSRTPVREALARLEHEGFVEIQPRKGVFIKRKSMEEILEMIVAWAALESMAARLASREASDKQIASLRQMVTKFNQDEAEAQLDEYSEANIRFHQRILEISKCSMLKSIADGLFLHMRAVRNRAMAEGGRVKHSVVDHMQIIDALENREAELACELVREHTLRLHAHVRGNWKEFIKNP